jgi:DeoR/GlpR family transcriptional regulator of sugar metabolism
VFAIERRRAIIDHVRTRGVVSLKELAAAVSTSEVTVRRDIRAMEEEGILDRRRGGAAWPNRPTHEQTYQQKSLVAAAEKVAIAQLACELLVEGDAIVVGAGTTTQAFARALGRFGDLTVVTNSILVAQELAPTTAEVVVTGGTLRGSTYALVGSSAEQSLLQVGVRHAFLSGNGLTAERGLSTPNMQSASIDQAIVRSAHDVVVLADHTKLGADTMVQTVAPESITHLVTDDKADHGVLDRLRSLGVQVHVAAVSGDR